jgi:hypothetical protein
LGIGITDIISNSVGTAHTIYTSIDHGLNRVTKVGIVSTGYGYGSGTAGTLYNARLVGFAGTESGVNATARISFDSLGRLTMSPLLMVVVLMVLDIHSLLLELQQQQVMLLVL